MLSNGDLENLKRFSALVGKENRWTQGPGGNTSLKKDGYIWVKASGKQLADAVSEEVFIQLKLQDNGGFKPIDTNSPLRPSIETFFHSEIGSKFVVHLHSTAAISLGVRSDCSKILSPHSNIALIPYTNPGSELAKSIQSLVNFQKQNIAILQNHGFLAWADDLNDIENSIKTVDEICIQNSLIDTSSKQRATEIMSPDFNKYLTPDHAVFCNGNVSEHEPDWLSSMKRELETALSYIPTSVAISFLSERIVKDLLGWESEKFRLIGNQ